MRAWGAACQYISDVAWERQEFHRVAVHQLTYHEVRQRFVAYRSCWSILAIPARRVAGAGTATRLTATANPPFCAVSVASLPTLIGTALRISGDELSLFSARVPFNHPHVWGNQPRCLRTSRLLQLAVVDTHASPHQAVIRSANGLVYV
jgi:hypothetical protein